MLGLKRGEVALYPHQKEWESEAQNTIRRLKKVLGNTVIDIDHVGSTSIPSIKAKPIIDIVIAVEDFDRVLALETQLRNPGFYYCPDIHKRQLLFASGSYYDGTGDMQTHFIHIVKADSSEWVDYINFRDYLIANPAVAKEYEALKESIASLPDIDREKYTASKHGFITQTLRKALAFSYLGKTVDVKIDRPIGSVHPQYPELVYPVNYGYIPDVIGGDGEELDVYLMGVDVPIKEYSARIIGIIYRHNDTEDKLVAAPEGMNFTSFEIKAATAFQEQYFESEIEVLYVQIKNDDSYAQRP